MPPHQTQLVDAVLPNATAQGTGTAAATPDAGAAQSIVITALGACLPERGTAVGTGAWDPARCAAVRH